MTRRLPPTGRSAFTMVELLIVIVIIALLAALLLAGVSRVQRMGAMTVAVNDISQLQMACEKFKQEHGFFPPSTYTIPAVKNSGDQNFILLTKMYPRFMSNQPDGTNTGLANAGSVLNGNQSMVYFLGGPAQTGWATDAPVAPAPTATAQKGPYFDFKADRLVAGNSLPAPFAAASALPVFLDPFKSPPERPNGTPFAYQASVTGGKYPVVPCYGVNAMCETSAKFINTGGVQIVSAGEDGLFGQHPANTVFTAGGGLHAPGTPGEDDLANFNNGNKLGVGR